MLLVSNHLSYLDVFFLGISARRPLNYVARSTLFVPVVACFMRSVGAFPIQREGMGASGMKETLRRLRIGRDRHALPRGDAQCRRRTRSAQVGDRGPGRAGGSARGPRRPGRHVRDVAALGLDPGPSPDPDSFRAAHPPRGTLRHGDRGDHGDDPGSTPGLLRGSPTWAPARSPVLIAGAWPYERASV